MALKSSQRRPGKGGSSMTRLGVNPVPAMGRDALAIPRGTKQYVNVEKRGEGQGRCEAKERKAKAMCKGPRWP